MPNKYESGTVNSIGIAGLGAGIKFILEEGPEKILSHEQNFIDQLMDGLAGIPGLTLKAAKNRSRQAPVISFNIEGYEPAEVGTILDQAFDIKVRSGLHCAPDAHKSLGTYPKGTVRLSPGYFNTPLEIEQTIQAINKIAAAKRKKE